MITNSRTWTAGAAVLAVVVLALSWFLLISPAIATAAQTNDEATAAADHNAALVRQTAKLKEQFEHLDTYRSELSALQRQIPSDTDLADFLRLVGTVATAHNTFVVSVTPSPSLSLADAAASAQAQAAPTATSSDSASASASGDPSPAPSASASESPTPAPAAAPTTANAGAIPAGMIGIPVSIELLGAPADVFATLDALRGNDQRLLTITDLTVAGQKEAEPAQGLPAIHRGDARATAAVLLYVLPGSDVSPTPAPTTTAPPPSGLQNGPLSPGSA